MAKSALLHMGLILLLTDFIYLQNGSSMSIHICIDKIESHWLRFKTAPIP